MSRIFNFSAGPAMLPAEVLARAGDEMLDWRGSGMSVMEMSHRGKEFMGIAAEAEKDLRELLAIPAGYKVLFLQGGATLQFAQIREMGRSTQGVTLISLDEGEKLAGLERIEERDVGANGNGNGNGSGSGESHAPEADEGNGPDGDIEPPSPTVH